MSGKHKTEQGFAQDLEQQGPPHHGHRSEYVTGEFVESGAPFVMQEVVANSGAVVSNLRQQELANARAKPHGEHVNERDYDDLMSASMVVKPKPLHQNPQTPTVLPSNYQPINAWSQFKATYLREFFAEFLGTMVLVFFGDSVVVQTRMSSTARVTAFLGQLESNGLSGSPVEYMRHLVTPDVAGSSISVNLCWASGVVMGYYAAGGPAITGAHMNPAVTLANYCFRGLPAVKVLIYWAAQMLGGYMGGLTVFWYYARVIKTTFPDWKTNESVIGCFSTVPLPYLDSNRQFISEFVIGALLIGLIFALTDPYTCLTTDFFPIMLFLLIFSLLACGSYQTGAILNPARDIGPRLAMWTVGFSRKALWEDHHHYFWVALVGPCVGGLVGALIYDLLIFQGHESPVNQPAAHVLKRLKTRFTSFGRKTASTGEYTFSDKELTDVSSNNPSGKNINFRSVTRGESTNGVPTIYSQSNDPKK
ncbi:FACL068Wp [Eremothecium gossypii FDAG1]|nr:FACL068Wp [Eremothecium gossypii FDAG1]